jgi:hypothetical protein
LKRGNERYFSKRFSSSSWRNDFPSSYARTALPMAASYLRCSQRCFSRTSGRGWLRPSPEGRTKEDPGPHDARVCRRMG